MRGTISPRQEAAASEARCAATELMFAAVAVATAAILGISPKDFRLHRLAVVPCQYKLSSRHRLESSTAFDKKASPSGASVMQFGFRR